MSAISLADIVTLEAEHGAVWPDGLELPSKAIWWYGCREFWWRRGLAAVILCPSLRGWRVSYDADISSLATSQKTISVSQSLSQALRDVLEKLHGLDRDDNTPGRTD